MMTSKECVRCKETKDISFFAWKVKGKKRLGHCRACQAIASADWYQKNKKRQLENVAATNKRYLEEGRQFIAKYKRSHPCIDCGCNDPRVLEFDHVRGKKKDNVSNLVSRKYPISTIEAEIAKCDVRCANCHRIRHCKKRRHS